MITLLIKSYSCFVFLIIHLHNSLFSPWLFFALPSCPPHSTPFCLLPLPITVIYSLPISPSSSSPFSPPPPCLPHLLLSPLPLFLHSPPFLLSPHTYPTPPHPLACDTEGPCRKALHTGREWGERKGGWRGKEGRQGRAEGESVGEGGMRGSFTVVWARVLFLGMLCHRFFFGEVHV